jgi:hypothetical protein
MSANSGDRLTFALERDRFLGLLWGDARGDANVWGG